MTVFVHLARNSEVDVTSLDSTLLNDVTVIDPNNTFLRKINDVIVMDPNNTFLKKYVIANETYAGCLSGAKCKL